MTSAAGPAVGDVRAGWPDGPRDTSPAGILRWAVRVGRWRNPVSMLLSFSHQVGEALVPVVVGLTIDHAVIPQDASAMIRWIAVLAGVFAVLSTSFLLHHRLAVRAGADAAYALRLRLTDHLIDPFERRAAAGTRVEIATEDVDAVSRVNAAGFAFGAGVGGLVVAVVAMFGINLTLGLLVVVGAIPVVLLMKGLGRPLQRRLFAERSHVAAATAIAADLLRGLRTVKGLGAEEVAGTRFARTSRRAMRSALRSARVVSVFEASAALISGCFVVVGAVVAGHLALDGRITVGSLVAALGLAEFVTGPMMMLTASAASLAAARASADRVSGLLEEQKTPSGAATGNVTPPHRLQVELDGIAWPLLLDTGLVGVVADDQVTGRLASALTGVPGDAADVRLDGVRLPDLDVQWLRGVLLVSPREEAVFTGTLGQNVDPWGERSPQTDSAVGAVCRAAQVDAVLEVHGWHSEVGEGGHLLSGGERQRVVLARALLADAPVLVLQDPTSAVDSVTETAVVEQVAALRRDRLTVVVTSSPAWLSQCAQVVWPNGETVESGTLADLGGIEKFAQEVLR